MCDEAGEFDVDRELIIPRSARSLPLTTRRRSEQLDTVVVGPTSPGTPALAASCVRLAASELDRFCYSGSAHSTCVLHKGNTAPILSAINAKSRAETFTSPNLKAAPQRDLLVMKDRCSTSGLMCAALDGTN